MPTRSPQTGERAVHGHRLGIGPMPGDKRVPAHTSGREPSPYSHKYLTQDNPHPSMIRTLSLLRNRDSSLPP